MSQHILADEEILCFTANTVHSLCGGSTCKRNITREGSLEKGKDSATLSETALYTRRDTETYWTPLKGDQLEDRADMMTPSVSTTTPAFRQLLVSDSTPPAVEQRCGIKHFMPREQACGACDVQKSLTDHEDLEQTFGCVEVSTHVEKELSLYCDPHETFQKIHQHGVSEVSPKQLKMKLPVIALRSPQHGKSEPPVASPLTRLWNSLRRLRSGPHTSVAIKELHSYDDRRSLLFSPTTISETSVACNAPIPAVAAVSESKSSEHTTSLRNLAVEMGVLDVLPVFYNGMNVRVVLHQHNIAGVVHAQLFLRDVTQYDDEHCLRRIPSLILESKVTKRQRALILDCNKLASAEFPDPGLFKNVKALPGSENIITQLSEGFYTDREGQRKRDALLCVSIPVRNSCSGSLLFILDTQTSVTNLMAVVAILQTYNDTSKEMLPC